MRLNLPGRIRNISLPQSRPLLPLFEAIINAFDAVEEAGQKRGSIQIQIVRDRNQLTLDPNKELPICGFAVQDDGIGFTDEHMAAFEESDSLYKQEKGGRGIGRLLWLKAFEEVEIDSTFRDAGTWYRRSFKFGIKHDGVGPMEKKEIASGPTRTVVKLNGWHGDYSGNSPRTGDTIARHVVEHCLDYFMSNNAPRVTLLDGEERIDVEQFFRDEILALAEETAFVIDETEFKTRTFKLFSPVEERNHRVHFCANGRAVVSEPLQRAIPNLSSRLKDDGSDRTFIVSAYVSGAYLDEQVTPDRSNFQFRQNDTTLFASTISWDSLRRAAVESITKQLQSALEAIHEDKMIGIQRYVIEKAPQYRPLLRQRKYLDEIPPGLSEEQLDVERKYSPHPV